MSIFDKLAAKVMPPESAEDRAEARRKAEQIAQDGGWLAAVLDHHRRIEQAFAEALGGGDRIERQAACKRLGVLLTGHAGAEESVIYPVLADSDEKTHAMHGYEEQAMVKVEMALLEKLDPLSREWREKLEHIQGAVLHHVYEEEGTWYPELQKKLSTDERALLTRRYLEEFDRYVGRGETTSAPPLQMAAQMAPEEPGLTAQQQTDWGTP